MDSLKLALKYGYLTVVMSYDIIKSAILDDYSIFS